MKIRDNADLKATVAVIDPAKTRRLDGRILFNGGDLSIVNTLIGSDEKVEGRLNRPRGALGHAAQAAPQRRHRAHGRKGSPKAPCPSS